MERYVIRIKDTDRFYIGGKTYSSIDSIFGELDKAKIFKNLAGAKVACYSLYTRDINLEIVGVELQVTDNIIDYTYTEPKIEEDKCPNCKSKNVEIHSGMYIDRYVCKDWGYEWRN